MKIFNTAVFLFSCFFVFLLSPFSLLAAEATFSWIPNEPAPAGYKIYYGIESRNYTEVIDVVSPVPVDGRIIETVTGLEEGETYYFAATAYSGNEESDYTDEIVHSVPVTTTLVAPVVNDISLQGVEDTPLLGQLLVDDSASVDTYNISSGPANGTLSVEDSSGSFSYTPGSNFSGVDTFIYSASNGAGTSAPATATITIAPVNDLPVASSSSFSVNEDNLYTGQLSASDVDDNSLTYSLVSQATGGTVSLSSSGTFTYAPNKDYCGSDSFTFKVNDGHGDSNTAMVTISINALNDVPVANSTNISLAEDSLYSGQLSASDIEDDSLVYAIVSLPASGTASVSSTGSFTYVPNQNVFGSDSFTFKVNDGKSDSNIAVVNIDINGVNDIPKANSTSISVDEDSSYSGQLTASDSDGDSLVFSIASGASQGTATVNPNGSFSYIPHQDISGSDSFTFIVNDGTTHSSSATVTVTINDVNDAPVAFSGDFVVDAGDSYSGQLVASDDGSTLTFSVVSVSENGTVSIAGDGSFTYTANADANGSDSFSFKVTDGSLESNTATVNIVVNEVQSEFAFEVGELLVTSQWQHVEFATTFINPSVVAKATTANDPESGVVSIRNLTSTGFDIRFTEWDYLDGVHPEEVVSFLAMESGYHQVTEQNYAVAGCLPVTGLNSYLPVTFSDALATQPLVLATVVSTNDSDAVTLRIKNIDNSGFSVAMQEQEDSDGFHGAETMCYIASEKMSFIIDDLMVEVASTDNILTHDPSTVAFTQPFSEIPFVVAGMQTVSGGNTAVLGLSGVTATGSTMTIVEEQSADSETGHIEEVGGYIAIAPFNPDEDNDSDGLINSRELELGTHPALADSDDDGMSDGQEYDYWVGRAFPEDADFDEDGLINLQDADSDNDGFLDGEEITAGYDPADAGSFPASLIKLEVGEVLVGSETVRVQLGNSYLQPVVIANMVTRNDSEPCVVRISEVSGGGFNIELQEYGYQDNSHGSETVSYLVMEAGVHILDDGTKIEAGLFSTDVTSSYESVSLSAGFSVKPVVLTSTMSKNDVETVTGRVRNITPAGFQYRLQEQEANALSHGLETIAYLAWSPGAGVANGIRFEVGITPDSVTHKSYNVPVTQEFSELPFHFANMQTTDGRDTSTLRIKQVGLDDLDVFVEEEGSKDVETRHTKEIAGFLVLLPQ